MHIYIYIYTHTHTCIYVYIHQVTVSYVDLADPPAVRQEALRSRFFFTCTCPRCAASPPPHAFPDEAIGPAPCVPTLGVFSHVCARLECMLQHA